MKKIMFLLSLSLMLFNASYSQVIQSIEIGEVFPKSHIDHPMKSIYGKEHRVSQHLNNDGLIIIFTIVVNFSLPLAWEAYNYNNHSKSSMRKTDLILGGINFNAIKSLHGIYEELKRVYI